VWACEYHNPLPQQEKKLKKIDTGIHRKLHSFTLYKHLTHKVNLIEKEKARSKTYVASSREYILSSYITWWAEIGCLVGDVAAPNTS